MQVVCSITARVHYLNRIISKLTNSDGRCYFYMQVYDGKLEIFQPRQSLISYFTITEKRFTSIDAYQDEPVVIVMNSDKLHEMINKATPKKVTLQAEKDPQEVAASKITVADPRYTRSADIDPVLSRNWENIARAFIQMHGINPEEISEVNNRNDAAKKIYQELIKLEQKDKLKTYPITSRKRFDLPNIQLPIDSMRRRTPMFIYDLLPQEFLYPDEKMKKIRNTFNDRGRWNPPGNHSTKRVYVETSVEALNEIIEAVDVVYDDDTHEYPITVESNELTVDVSDDGNSLSGTLPSKKIEGQSCHNIYDWRFAEAVDKLSGDVELHTAPGARLAIIKRNRGHIYRYIIQVKN